MSRRSSAAEIQRHADIFSALGDPIRLALVSKLVGGEPQSISSLTEGTKVTRQAVTKHLRVLEDVGMVHSIKEGRESLYELDAKPLESLKEYLEVIAGQWEKTLQNFKEFVEKS